MFLLNWQKLQSLIATFTLTSNKCTCWHSMRCTCIKVMVMWPTVMTGCHSHQLSQMLSVTSFRLTLFSFCKHLNKWSVLPDMSNSSDCITLYVDDNACACLSPPLSSLYLLYVCSLQNYTDFEISIQVFLLMQWHYPRPSFQGRAMGPVHWV